jgi:hypothetical protein
MPRSALMDMAPGTPQLPWPKEIHRDRLAVELHFVVQWYSASLTACVSSLVVIQVYIGVYISVYISP